MVTTAFSSELHKLKYKLDKEILGLRKADGHGDGLPSHLTLPILDQSRGELGEGRLGCQNPFQSTANLL